MKKVFASDFDGTLYFYKAEVKLPPENVEKIKEYQAAGGLFGLCTGRQVGGLTPFIGGIIKPDFYITSTGANIVDGDFNDIFRRGIDRDIVDEICKFVNPNDPNEHRISIDINGVINVFAEMDYPGEYHVITGMKDAMPGLVHQLGVHNETFEEAAALAKAINEKFGDYINAFQNVVEVDIAPKGCTKGKGVERLRKFYADKYDGIKLYGKVDTSLPFGVQVLQSNLNYYETALQALKKQGKKWQYSVGGGINNFMWAFDDIVNYQPYRSSCCSSAQNWIVKDFGEKSRTDFCTVININEAYTFKQLYESGKIRKGDLIYGVRYDNGKAIMHEYINYDFTTTFDTGHGSGGWHSDPSIKHSDPRKAVFDTFMNPMKTSFSYTGYKIRKIFRIRNDYVPKYYRNEKGILTKMPAGVKA